MTDNIARLGIRGLPSAGVWALILYFSVAEAPATSNEMYVVGLSEVDTSGRVEGHSYWVDWAHLPGRVTWCPETEELPLELDQAVLRARGFLAKSKGITYARELTSFQIVRLSWPSSEQLRAHQKTTADFTNQWFLTLYFGPGRVKGRHKPEHRTENVVMLLDGTYGQERPLKQPKPNMPSHGPDGNVGEERSDLPAKPGSGFAVTAGDGPGKAALGAPGLPISAIQWAAGGRLSVSLSHQARSLKRQLAAKFGASEGCFLKEITANTFAHEAPQSGHGLSPPLVLHDWLLYYYFSEPSSGSDPKYAVTTMLDGTVVEMKKVSHR